MCRNLLVLLLALVVAPLALATGAPVPAADPDVASVAVEAAEADAETNDALLADLFAELDPLAGAESKYICMEGCTNERDCELNQDPSYCPAGAVRMCDNPTGRACAGTCFCC